MKKIKKSNVAEFLLENGLIFEINRQILHPLGLAIEVEVDDETNEKIEFSCIWDCRDDPEGILFSEETFETGKDKFQKYLKEQGQQSLDSRQEKLGFLIQENSKQ